MTPALGIPPLRPMSSLSARKPRQGELIISLSDALMADTARGLGDPPVSGPSSVCTRFADRAKTDAVYSTATTKQQVNLVGRRGIEPRTIGLKVRCSAN